MCVFAVVRSGRESCWKPSMGLVSMPRLARMHADNLQDVDSVEVRFFFHDA